MIFAKKERLLRISKNRVLGVCIYVQEQHVSWLTDVLLQEILQAIKPKLHDKIIECKQETRTASPIVKDEDTQINEDDSQFSYSALYATLNALILVPEPFDPNNTVALPEMLNINIE
ncbi:hypothetical protein LPJ77_000774 [Coemansia sp. RSA 2523]|nr:hypothetical protein LPJ77_000774 [Coemansia sp. RSA 2523]